MFEQHAMSKVQSGEWTKEEAEKWINKFVEIDLMWDKFDEEMSEYWKKLKELKH